MRQLTAVLLGELVVDPLLKFGFGLVDRDLAAHLVMAPAAQLGADQLELTGRVGVEPDRDRHARNGILLDPQMRQEERVEHVRRLQIDQRLLVLDEMQVVDREEVVAACSACRPARGSASPTGTAGR